MVLSRNNLAKGGLDYFLTPLELQPRFGGQHTLNLCDHALQ